MCIYIYICACVCVCVCVSLCVVLYFDALAQASDIRRISLLNAGFELGKSQTPNRQQTQCPLTNRMSYEGSNKTLNSTALLYDEWAFSPLDFTAVWLSHLALAIYMFVVVDVDALAQTSDIRIERRQVVFLRWMQDSNLEVSRHLFASRLNAHWQTDLTVEDQAKPWTQQPFSMMSEHSAHLTSLPFGFRTWLWRYTCLLLLMLMPWHRQAIFESKGDKLSSSAECRTRTQGLRHIFASRLNACWQTDWATEYQAKNLNSTAHPYDQQAFNPLDLTAIWLSHLALATYMFFVVNFDALAQASDIRIEMRQVVFLCWMQDSNPRSQTPIRQQTECLLTNRLSYRGSN